MHESLHCHSCNKAMKKTRIVVIHPKNNNFMFVCCEACARNMLVSFCSNDHTLDFSTIKIYFNREAYKEIPIFKNIKKKTSNKIKKKKKPITNNDVLDFKINFGLNSDTMLKKLIDSGEALYNKEPKNQ